MTNYVLKKTIRKILVIAGSIALTLYSLLCFYLYLKQESILFKQSKIPAYYSFGFAGQVQEKFTRASDGVLLSTLLFKADSAKGVILYLHGNGGTLTTWGTLADTYIRLHYDVLMMDYRGYGKSGGEITNEAQLYDDVQQVYNDLLKDYPENKITLLGYSMGTGFAAWLAAHNHPKRLILQAPYYSMTALMKEHFPFAPTFILKYKLKTNECLPHIQCPIIIFHGDADYVIHYKQSLQLQQFFKPGDRLIVLPNQGHNGITENEQYIGELGNVL